MVLEGPQEDPLTSQFGLTATPKRRIKVSSRGPFLTFCTCNGQSDFLRGAWICLRSLYLDRPWLACAKSCRVRILMILIRILTRQLFAHASYDLVKQAGLRRSIGLWLKIGLFSDKSPKLAITLNVFRGGFVKNRSILTSQSMGYPLVSWAEKWLILPPKTFDVMASFLKRVQNGHFLAGPDRRRSSFYHFSHMQVMIWKSRIFQKSAKSKLSQFAPNWPAWKSEEKLGPVYSDFRKWLGGCHPGRWLKINGFQKMPHFARCKWGIFRGIDGLKTQLRQRKISVKFHLKFSSDVAGFSDRQNYPEVAKLAEDFFACLTCFVHDFLTWLARLLAVAIDWPGNPAPGSPTEPPVQGPVTWPNPRL